MSDVFRNVPWNQFSVEFIIFPEDNLEHSLKQNVNSWRIECLRKIEKQKKCIHIIKHFFRPLGECYA
jgi:hypothetical protein